MSVFSQSHVRRRLSEVEGVTIRENRYVTNGTRIQVLKHGKVVHNAETWKSLGYGLARVLENLKK